MPIVQAVAQVGFAGQDPVIVRLDFRGVSCPFFDGVYDVLCTSTIFTCSYSEVPTPMVHDLPASTSVFPGWISWDATQQFKFSVLTADPGLFASWSRVRVVTCVWDDSKSVLLWPTV